MTSDNCKNCGGTRCDPIVPFLDCEACQPAGPFTHTSLSAPEQEPEPMLCPGCELPMIDGQIFNGGYGCHWDCTDKVREQERRDNPRPPTESDLRWDELKKSIDEVGNLAIQMEKERDALQLLLNDRDEKLDALEAEKYALEDQVRELQELMAEQGALFGKYGDTLRPFVELMRKELEANSHKGDREGWLGMTTGTAIEEVEHHLRKLRNAVAYVWQDEIKEHAADVGNCCMMLLDVMGLLIEPPRIFGMNLVVDGNMPDDEMHLVAGDGGTVKLVVNDGKARDV